MRGFLTEPPNPLRSIVAGLLTGLGAGAAWGPIVLVVAWNGHYTWLYAFATFAISGYGAGIVVQDYRFLKKERRRLRQRALLDAHPPPGMAHLVMTVQGPAPKLDEAALARLRSVLVEELARLAENPPPDVSQN